MYISGGIQWNQDEPSIKKWGFVSKKNTKLKTCISIETHEKNKSSVMFRHGIVIMVGNEILSIHPKHIIYHLVVMFRHDMFFCDFGELTSLLCIP